MNSLVENFVAAETATPLISYEDFTKLPIETRKAVLSVLAEDGVMPRNASRFIDGIKPKKVSLFWSNHSMKRSEDSMAQFKETQARMQAVLTSVDEALESIYPWEHFKKLNLPAKQKIIVTLLEAGFKNSEISEMFAGSTVENVAAFMHHYSIRRSDLNVDKNQKRSALKRVLEMIDEADQEVVEQEEILREFSPICSWEDFKKINIESKRRIIITLLEAGFKNSEISEMFVGSTSMNIKQFQHNQSIQKADLNVDRTPKKRALEKVLEITAEVDQKIAKRKEQLKNLSPIGSWDDFKRVSMETKKHIITSLLVAGLTHGEINDLFYDSTAQRVFNFIKNHGLGRPKSEMVCKKIPEVVDEVRETLELAPKRNYKPGPKKGSTQQTYKRRSRDGTEIRLSLEDHVKANEMLKGRNPLLRANVDYSECVVDESKQKNIPGLKRLLTGPEFLDLPRKTVAAPIMKIMVYEAALTDAQIRYVVGENMKESMITHFIENFIYNWDRKEPTISKEAAMIKVQQILDAHYEAMENLA